MKEPRLNLAVGTNPISVAAPGKCPGEEFVLDMASSAVALGKIEMMRRKKLEIPESWAGDAAGNATRDPNIVMTGGGLFPLGGTEETSGYKGFGLGMMVELFCGILTGSAWGLNIRRWMDVSRPANLGQSFVAIDPGAFGDNFNERLSDYLATMRNLARSDPDLAVIVPGDPERAHMAECDSQGAIRYPPVLIDSLNSLADRIEVPRMKVLKKIDG